VGHDGDESKRDEDRDDCEEERERGRDERAEDDHQDDQRRRRAEERLAVLEVGLGKLQEIVVDRPRPGHCGGETRIAVSFAHEVDHLLHGLGLGWSDVYW